MNNPVIILNFTHAYENMAFLHGDRYRWIDCTHLSGTECYCDAEGEARLREMLAPYPPEGIHLIDSGDYHYVTRLWTDKIHYPFSLVLFDHHPDMQPPLFDSMLSCGSWVRDMLDNNPYLQKVCIVGASEKLKKETEGYDRRLLYFSEQTLKYREAWHLFSQFYLNTPVYVSVDKDVLVPRYATTNWDQGSLSLSQLESLLLVILRHEKVIGVDICGEIPFCQLADVHESPSVLQGINEKTDEELLKVLERKWKNRSQTDV